MNDLTAKKISEAAQKELDTLLKKFEDDFAKTIERISTLDIVAGSPALVNTGEQNTTGDDIRALLTHVLNQQFKRQKTPLERQVNHVGGQVFNTVFSTFFGEDIRTPDFNPSANPSMRLSQSQIAADIFSIISRSGRNS